MSTTLIFVSLITPLAILLHRKSVLLCSFQIFGSLALAGTSLAVSNRIHGLVHVEIAQLIVILSFLTIFFSLSLASKSRSFTWNYKEIPLVVISISVALVLVISRVQASTVIDGLFAGAGRLAAAEDNAKWINFSSNVAQANLLNFNDGTSGGLAALILITSAFVSYVSEAFFGGINVPGITIQSVLISHNLLLVLAPLAITPAAFSIWGVSAKWEPKLSKFYKKCGIGIAGLFSVFAVAAPMAYGHLSFEFILVFLIFWATYVVNNRLNSKYLFLISFIGSSVALVWLPLPNFAIVIAATGIVIWLVFSRQRKTMRSYIQGFLLVLSATLTLWLSTPMLQYLAHTTAPPQLSTAPTGNQSNSNFDLVVAEGETMVAGKIEFLLLVFCLVGMIFAITKTPNSERFSKSISVYPIIYLLGYACAVSAYDFYIASEGWPHYGARKLIYGFVCICIAVLLPIVIFLLVQISEKKQWMSGLALVLIAGTIFSSGSFRRSSFLFTIGAWTTFETRNPTPGVGFETWLELASPGNSPSTLDNYPILCVETDKTGIIVGVTDQYYCSRFLIAMHGLEATGNILLIPELTSPVSDETLANISELAKDIGKSPILEIDKFGNVKKKLDFAEYLSLIEYSNEQRSS